jgi:hypothetical protein
MENSFTCILAPSLRMTSMARSNGVNRSLNRTSMPAPLQS